MKPPLLCSVLLHFVFFGSGQTKNVERLLVQNKIKTKNVYSYSVKKNGSFSDKTLLFSSLLNDSGFSTVTRKFLPDGSVARKYIYDYQADTQKVKEVAYQGEQQMESELYYVYDGNGNPIYHKQVMKSNGNTIEQFRLFDSLNRDTALYTSRNGKPRKLTGQFFYDSSGKRSETISIDDIRLKSDTSVYKYDRTEKILRIYSKSGDSLRLTGERIYNQRWELSAIKSYIDFNGRTRSNDGQIQDVKMGDISYTVYNYDERGLPTEEIRSHNGKVQSRITYEYLQ